MTEPLWLGERIVLAVHDAQLARHGGAGGMRDVGLLGSALARPRNLNSCAEDDLCVLAAQYAAGILRNRPFVDGNKRTGFIAADRPPGRLRSPSATAPTGTAAPRRRS